MSSKNFSKEANSAQQLTPPASAEGSTSAKQYNVVYEKLVDSKDDFVGLLAYCLYKQSKQDFIREFEQLNNRSPSNEELSNHVTCSEIPRLDMYRQEALRSVQELLSQAASEKEEELEKHFKDRLWLFIHRHEPEGFLEKHWRSFKGLLYGGVGGVFGNFFTTLLLILFLFWSASTDTRDSFFISAKENLVSGLAEVMGVEVTLPKKIEKNE